MVEKIKKWHDKGEGGQFYEPYITNGDVVKIIILTIITCTLIIMGCYLMILKG
jgi:hypothetical protein